MASDLMRYVGRKPTSHAAPLREGRKPDFTRVSEVEAPISPKIEANI